MPPSKSPFLRLDPNRAIAQRNLAITLDDIGDLDGAITAYGKALRLEPDHVNTHYNLGNAFRGKGDQGGAIGAYREALRLGVETRRRSEFHDGTGHVAVIA